MSKDVTKLEEKIEELKVKLYSSEAEKANLQRSVSMLQNQVALAPHKSQAVGEVQSRIDSVSSAYWLSQLHILVRHHCLKIGCQERPSVIKKEHTGYGTCSG